MMNSIYHGLRAAVLILALALGAGGIYTMLEPTTTKEVVDESATLAKDTESDLAISGFCGAVSAEAVRGLNVENQDITSVQEVRLWQNGRKALLINYTNSGWQVLGLDDSNVCEVLLTVSGIRHATAMVDSSTGKIIEP